MIFTSNRVGQIDEAFRSAFTCALLSKLTMHRSCAYGQGNSAGERLHCELDMDDEGIRGFAKLLGWRM